MSDPTDIQHIPLSAMESIKPAGAANPNRRRFLAGAVSLIGVAAVGMFADLLVNNMNPGKAVAAEGAPVDVDVSKLEPGQLILVEWKKKPVWIMRRPKSMLATLSEPGLLQRLKDPHCLQAQQPDAKFINGNYRALNPEYFIAVALCTHLQCIPDFRPKPKSVTPWWFGGFHCPCHGSMYDLSARVIEGSPAPLNIPIPPYFWTKPTVARIGESDSAGLQQDWEPSIW
ncbi:MAG TPA: ubiquinol-cytochrome c reductase iron-sulfur subunit [Rhodanobacteraceae bacterium]